ncbi:MAG: hypothetical protein LBE37_03055 [Sphingobacterium sp.]|jgi:hypothetical protein|nr:hypothetical protein [Sphingobacterium sp.]
MNKILKKISAVVQLVLLAPVKLPGKALHVVRYIALGLGVLEAMTGDGKPVPNSLRDELAEEGP